MAFQGFAVLAWVRDDSPLLMGVSSDTRDRIEQQLLRDFCCLISVRWNMEVKIVELNGTKYAYGNNTRITASERTIRNALGTLTDHVQFIKSTASTDAEALADYRVCREKWNVPDQVTDTSFGWEQRDPPETSQQFKRKRTL